MNENLPPWDQPDPEVNSDELLQGLMDVIDKLEQRVNAQDELISNTLMAYQEMAVVIETITAIAASAAGLTDEEVKARIQASRRSWLAYVKDMLEGTYGSAEIDSAVALLFGEDADSSS